MAYVVLVFAVITAVSAVVYSALIVSGRKSREEEDD